MEAGGWKKLRDGRWKKWVIDNDKYGGQMMEEMGDDRRTGQACNKKSSKLVINI